LAAGNGFLTAEEVLVMDLDRTELVVLSACHTGVGSVHASEGVMSVRRSFHIAGARAVVATLWAIPDRPARRFMALLYEELAAGQPEPAALRTAQCRYRDAFTDGVWAAFDLSAAARIRSYRAAITDV
jgi:CHAT domain-containing protein